MAIKTINKKRYLDKLIETCKSNLPSVNEEMLTKAFELSFEAHKNDSRASGEPYFIHPYEVAMLIASEIPLDDVSVICALLHDVVEDTGFDLQFIKKEFGKEIAEIVDGVTKIGGVFRGQDIIKAENYRKLLLSMVKDVRVILVKFADRLHNMRTLEFVSTERQQRIARETLDIYAPFAHRFGLAGVKWELEDLAFKYSDKGAYEDIARKIKNKRREREGYIRKFISPIKDKLKEHKIKCDISGRPKHLYSIYRKMIKRNKPFEEIFDLFAVRIILESNDSNECYYVLGVLNQIYTPVPDRFKDYVSIPKTNNYQSIHSTVIGPEGRAVEVQIRTRDMHEISERGVAAHWKYKGHKFTGDSELEHWGDWIRSVFDIESKDEASREILASFRLNLYQDEIYVFTPKGELRRLPVKSTPVDFAFDIHSDVGFHCIGANVNGQIVPLHTMLHSGDQVEIITSKKQHPNRDWLMFTTTGKARSAIHRWINKEEKTLIQDGKNIWDKKVRKLKLTISPDDLAKLSKTLKYDGTGPFFKAIAQEKVDLDKVLVPPKEKEAKDTVKDLEFDSFTNTARDDAGGILVDGENENVMHSFAKCCNPIPGDSIIGYTTIGEGIKIHRKTCGELLNNGKKGEDRLIPVQWPRTEKSLFIAGISIVGEDISGILKDISHSITSYQNTNIKSVNIDANNSMIKGAITLYVKNLDHLSRVIERLKNNKGIYSVERFHSSNIS
ncbi:MAG: bifunctional (p)ppGpp synthetase/guanosine-3',5'-bis(diphosphate) 3'-pyrophosphohydrolase [Ignavibacteria bacterium]